jgi:hypothetical protein
MTPSMTAGSAGQGCTPAGVGGLARFEQSQTLIPPVLLGGPK